VDDLAKRVLRRWATSKEIPVKNKDTGRTVYVLPETLKKDPDKFERLDPNERPPGKAKPRSPRRPRKPERPEVPRDAPPAPVKPPVSPKKVKPVQPVKPVPPLDLPKVPEPSPHRKWKKLKRYQASSQTVVERFNSED